MRSSDLGVGFVLDFGELRRCTGVRHDLPGLDGLEDSDAVRLVDERGRRTPVRDRRVR